MLEVRHLINPPWLDAAFGILMDFESLPRTFLPANPPSPREGLQGSFPTAPPYSAGWKLGRGLPPNPQP